MILLIHSLHDKDHHSKVKRQTFRLVAHNCTGSTECEDIWEGLIGCTLDTFGTDSKVSCPRCLVPLTSWHTHTHTKGREGVHSNSHISGHPADTHNVQSYITTSCPVALAQIGWSCNNHKTSPIQTPLNLQTTHTNSRGTGGVTNANNQQSASPPPQSHLHTDTIFKKTRETEGKEHRY